MITKKEIEELLDVLDTNDIRKATEFLENKLFQAENINNWKWTVDSEGNMYRVFAPICKDTSNDT